MSSLNMLRKFALNDNHRYTAIIEGRASADDAKEINAVIRSLDELRQKRNEVDAHITVYLKGVFNIYTHIDLPSNISLTGLPSRDRFRPLLIRVPNNDYIAQVSITNSNHAASGYSGNRNIIIENLEIDHSSVTSRGNVIFICHSENIVVRRCKITQGTVTQGHCVEVNGCRNALITDNEFIFPALNSTNLESVQYDISLSGTQSPIPDKVFNADGTNSEHIIVMRNWFNGCNVAVGTHTAPTSYPKVYVYENLIEKMHVYGIRNMFSRMCIRNNQIRNQPANVTYSAHKYGIVQENTSSNYSVSAILGNNISNLMTIISTEFIRGIVPFSGVDVVTANNIYRTYNSQIYGSDAGNAVMQHTFLNNMITSDSSRDVHMLHLGANTSVLWSIIGVIANEPRASKSNNIINAQTSQIMSIAGVVTPNYTGALSNMFSSGMRGNSLQFIGNANTSAGFFRLVKGTTTGSSQSVTTPATGTNSKLNVSANSLSAIDAFISSGTTFSFTGSSGQNYWLKIRQRT